MICDRVHILECGHMNVAEPTSLSLWLGNLAALYATPLAFILALLLPFGCKLCFDAQCLFSEFVHHPLRIGAKLGTGASKAEVERSG